MNRFKELRTKSGLTQKDVADIIGISQVSVCQWECGDNLPRADKLNALAELYGCTVDELLKQSERPA